MIDVTVEGMNTVEIHFKQSIYNEKAPRRKQVTHRFVLYRPGGFNPPVFILRIYVFAFIFLFVLGIIKYTKNKRIFPHT